MQVRGSAPNLMWASSVPDAILGPRWGWGHRWWRPGPCFGGWVCWGRREVKGQRRCSSQNIRFLHVTFQGRGLGVSAGNSVPFPFKDFTNRTASWTELLFGLYEAWTHCLNMEKQLQTQAKNTGSGAVHLNLAKSHRKNKGLCWNWSSPSA